MTQNAAAGVLAEPFVIEIEVDGKWVQVGSDNNAEYVESRRRFLDTYIEGFADDLRKCGWSGPALGKIRVRDLRHTAPSFVQEFGPKGDGFKVTMDNLRHTVSTSELLIIAAKRWREQHGYVGQHGCVVFFEGVPNGWILSADYSPKERWRPGCIAVSGDGKLYEAVGGNYQDGADRWVAREAVPS